MLYIEVLYEGNWAMLEFHENVLPPKGFLSSVNSHTLEIIITLFQMAEKEPTTTKWKQKELTHIREVLKMGGNHHTQFRKDI